MTKRAMSKYRVEWRRKRKKHSKEFEHSVAAFNRNLTPVLQFIEELAKDSKVKKVRVYLVKEQNVEWCTGHWKKWRKYNEGKTKTSA